MYRTYSPGGGFGTGIMPGIKNLLIANIIGFFLGYLMRGTLFHYFALIPRYAVFRLYIWQFVTYMFLHGDILHIFFNMYALWIFGSEMERMWGTKAFIKYYFVTGIGAGIIHAIINIPFGGMIPTIGASGAVMGVLMAFALTFPERRITFLLFFIFPISMKAKQLVIIFGAISLFFGMTGARDGIAHFAHLGGLLVGYLYIKRGTGNLFNGLSKTIADFSRKRNMRVKREKEENLDKLRRIVDAILDKANEVGMENLTKEEKELLKKAGKILRKERDG